MSDPSRIDLYAQCSLLRLNEDFDPGANRFLALLSSFEGSNFFASMHWSGSVGDIKNNQSAFIESYRESNREEIEKEQLMSIGATGAVGETPIIRLHYIWRSKRYDSLNVEFYRSHPDNGTSTQMYVELIDIVTAWRRPQHIICQPFLYLRDYHPFDRARSGIGWIGWIPFELSPSDVAEAHRVEPMNGGTLIVSQPHFWQAGGPEKDDAAIARAQEIDMKLNLLGVLPTIVELERGDWGQP